MDSKTHRGQLHLRCSILTSTNKLVENSSSTGESALLPTIIPDVGSASAEATQPRFGCEMET